MIPVAGGLPQFAGQDGRGLNEFIAILGLLLSPVLGESVLELHAVGEPEREARALVDHHEELHLLANFAVVPLFGFGDELLVLGQLILVPEGYTIDTSEHLIIAVRSPVGTRGRGELEGLQRLGVTDVRAGAHVNVVALLEEADLRVLRQVVNMFEFILLMALRHEFFCVLTGQDEGLEGKVLLADLLHLILNFHEVLVGDLHVAEVDVIVKALVRGRSEAEVGLRPEVGHRLCHDMGGGVAENMELLLLRADGYVAVAVDDFHG